MVPRNSLINRHLHQAVQKQQVAYPGKAWSTTAACHDALSLSSSCSTPSSSSSSSLLLGANNGMPLHASSISSLEQDPAYDLAGVNNTLYKRKEYTSMQKPHGGVLSTVVAPISIIGGTAAVYTAVLRHPSSDLQPQSLFYLLLLAFQYALQPKLSKMHLSNKINKQKVALAEEGAKTIMAAGLWIVISYTQQEFPIRAIQHELSRWTWQSCLTIAGIPAVLYAIQGVLQYQSYLHLDPITFQGLTQTKTLSAALCCYLVLGKRQSHMQTVALVLLFFSALLFQQQQQSKSSLTNTQPIQSQQQQQKCQRQLSHDDWFLKGIMPCLGATFLSGLAGAFSQQGLQRTGGSGRNAYLFTMEVSILSALTLLISLGRDHMSKMVLQTRDRRFFHRLDADPLAPQSNTKGIKNRGGGGGGGGNDENSLSDDDDAWNKKTWIPILWKAAGGVLTALVHKSLGTVAKGFALMLALVFASLWQWYSTLQQQYENGTRTALVETFSPLQLAGTLLVMLSSWLHFTSSPR